MKLKLFQKQDLARAALHDGAVLSWDTGLGKTWALFLWPLLKVGFRRAEDVLWKNFIVTEATKQQSIPTTRVAPNAPVLIIAPGDLHQQIANEAWDHFKIRIVPLDSQETFTQLTRQSGSALTRLSPDGRPNLVAEFYITSYSQLTTNQVDRLPDPDDWDKPQALLEFMALKVGPHVPLPGADMDPPDTFDTVAEFFAWRGKHWMDEYSLLNVSPADTLEDLERSLTRINAELARWIDQKAAASKRKEVHAAYDTLQNLMPNHLKNGEVMLSQFNQKQRDFVIRAFCQRKVEEYGANEGRFREYRLYQGHWVLMPPYNPDKPIPDQYKNCPTKQIKCVYSPSLADLAYNAFDAVVIDEGVKMKGEDTFVGRGIRSMIPKYRLVLTATPIKNRLPDIFRLAWWATGGRTEAHARWPYRDDSGERTKFAETFLVSEHNLTKEAEAAAGEKGNPRAILAELKSGARKSVNNSRYKKLTAEVCNIHRLWKLFGPIVLRRRKQDCGEDIVPKIRRVVRCEMGTHQRRVYQYHLGAMYLDKHGEDAICAKLQALRMAAADPASTHLENQGEVTEECSCRNGERKNCTRCLGSGRLPLPHRSGTNYIPKVATALQLIHEILERKEQVMVFSAFNDPLDNLSKLLDEAQVRHVKLDGRTSQKRRGQIAAVFKRGRQDQASLPVMLAGVECMAEGHSFNLANNVILIAYSWAYDKFKQALDRVHRMNSVKPVNIYVVICTGTIDRKLESLVQEKGDSAELVLDGQLMGERSAELNLAELLNIAQKEFNTKDNTIDEALLHQQWPQLRDRLAGAMRAWEPEVPAMAIARSEQSSNPSIHQSSNPTIPQPSTRRPMTRRPSTLTVKTPAPPTHDIKPPAPPETPSTPHLTRELRPSIPAWRQRMVARANQLASAQRGDLWSQL